MKHRKIVLITNLNAREMKRESRVLVNARVVDTIQELNPRIHLKVIMSAKDTVKRHPAIDHIKEKY